MATQEDRSLGAGSFFPKWMKNKSTSSRFDLEQNAFSPTELDDSFMYYYRHQKNDNVKQVITTNTTTTSRSMDVNIVKASQKQITSGQADFSNITAVDTTLFKDKVGTATTEKPQILNQNKPKGTDDGYTGETAKIGSSVIRVANQMVSGKITQNIPAKPEEECEQLLAKFDPYRRRGSKSLPASPLATPDSSPKSKRRINKYFTNPYSEENGKHKGWILSNFLAQREISKSIGHINEESKDDLDRASSTASIDDVGTHTSADINKVFTLKPTPSELREMNFWSPTSM